MRSRTLYDNKGKLREIVDGLVVWEREPPTPSTYNIHVDNIEFVSPIDGTIVRGRSGLADHCKRHDVVLTADLAGLPPKPMVRHNYSPEYREATRRVLADIINSKY